MAGAGAARQALYDYMKADEGGKAAAYDKAAEQLKQSISSALEAKGLDKWTRQRLEGMLDNIDSKGEMVDNKKIYIIYNKTHKDSMPVPKGKGQNGGRLQSHHGLQKEWAISNLS